MKSHQLRGKKNAEVGNNLFFLLIIATSAIHTYSSLAVANSLYGNSPSVDPPIIFSSSEVNAVIWNMGTKANVTCQLNNTKLETVPHGGFTDGFDGWRYYSNRDNLQAYWINGSSEPEDHVELVGTYIPAGTYIAFYGYIYIVNRVDFMNGSISSITLRYDYYFTATWFRSRNMILSVRIVDVKGNYTEIDRITIRRFTLSIPWSTREVSINFNPVAGTRYYLVFLIYVPYGFPFLANYYNFTLGLDNVSLIAQYNNYALGKIKILELHNNNGYYIAGLNITDIDGSGDAYIALVNGRYRSTLIVIDDGNIVNGSTSYIPFNSSDPLLKQGYIELSASMQSDSYLRIKLAFNYENKDSSMIISYELFIELRTP